jgi:FlaA1/EpsC-like NDP-sugar epimerase
MLAQRNEINLQLLKVCDAALLGLTFWFAHFLRYNRVIVLDRIVEIDPFSSFVWMLAVIIPFAPFFLETQGFYNHPQEKTAWRSMQKITMAGIWLFVLLGAAVIFLRLEVPSRSVLILFVLFAPCVLLLREQLVIANYHRKVRAGNIGERIILAGEPACMDAMMASFTPVQKMEMLVVDRIDLTTRAIEDFVSSLHKHSVGRVILAFQKPSMRVPSAWRSRVFPASQTGQPAYPLPRSRMTI